MCNILQSVNHYNPIINKFRSPFACDIFGGKYIWLNNSRESSIPVLRQRGEWPPKVGKSRQWPLDSANTNDLLNSNSRNLDKQSNIVVYNHSWTNTTQVVKYGTVERNRWRVKRIFVVSKLSRMRGLSNWKPLWQTMRARNAGKVIHERNVGRELVYTGPNIRSIPWKKGCGKFKN